MIDRHLLPLQKALLTLPARALSSIGVSADQVTLVGFGLAVLSFAALTLGWFGTGLVLFLLNRLMDGLDGALARATTPTDRGAFIDIAADFLTYALIPLGFACADPAANALAAAVLITSFVGTGSSFLAFASIAARRGMTAPAYPAKGIYYLGGLTEGAETIGCFILMFLFPAWFSPLAWGYALLCFASTGLRWHMGWAEFSLPESEERPE